MKHVLAVAVACAAILGFCLPSHAASFDCSKAATPDEHAVCSDAQLSDLDTLLGRAFIEAKKFPGASDPSEAAKTQAIAHRFFAQRRACGTTKSCIIGSYVGALEGYMTQGSTVEIPAWVSASMIAGGKAPETSVLPAALGQCSRTKVEIITPRLGDGGPVKPEDWDSGTAINFVNGGHQVSYDREPALRSSKPGDEVVMCLIFIPIACPKGDDRGRSYTVTNLRTSQTWSLPDSQHLCGGA